MNIINFGSLNYDYVYSVEHIVNSGETINSENMETFCGGKGLNQSIALSKAGIKVFHAGIVGEDGDELIDICRKNNINTKYIKKAQSKSGHTIIQVDKSGQNSIILYGGSNRKFTKDFIDEILSDFGKGDIILLQNEINLIDYIIDKAYELNMFIALNPSPYNEFLNKCDLSKISLFFINEIEGRQMTGFENPDSILDKLSKNYKQSQFVLTLGENGVIYKHNNIIKKQKAFSVEAIDTTAAGDTFTGYFLSGIINKYDIEKTLYYSSKASAIAITRKGASSSIPTLEEVMQSEL